MQYKKEASFMKEYEMITANYSSKIKELIPTCAW